MTDTNASDGKAPRESSTVQFPYADLDEAIAVVRAIQQTGGMPLERDQIAARMAQKATSGAFITKLSAARMFGLTESQPGTPKIRITQLGHEAIDADEARQRAAKASAFLNVELYGKLYNDFRGRQLPSRPVGLEQAMVTLGVAPKQRTNARYAFDRSAKQAGYFDHGSDRLVAPAVMAVTPQDAPHIDLTPATAVAHATASGTELALDGVITALIAKLPRSKRFPVTDRKKWLTMMEMALEMAYPEPYSLEADPPADIDI